MDDESSPQHEAQDKPDLALDLNFVPGWARTPPDNPYAGREHFRDDDRRRGHLTNAEPFGAQAGSEPERSERGIDAAKEPSVADAHHAATGGEPAHRHPTDRPLECDGRGVETDHVGGGYCP